MKLFVLFIFAATLMACNGCQHNPAPTPTNVSLGDAAYSPPDGPATCLDVCRAGQALGCTWAAPTAAGATCVDVCVNAQQIAPWDLGCRARAKSCAAVDACQ